MTLICAAGSLLGQDVLENNPPSIKWSQVNTPHFRVVFPKGFDREGQRVASTLEGIHEAEAQSLGSFPRKISVILQNQSSESNGFVSFLPRRSEFYTMPSQNYNFTGTNDWLNLLASHEYRHIVQYQHAVRGFNRLFYYVFGGATLAGMAQVAAPDWFWEGDAVVAETAFTPGGRGKIPFFSRVFRSNLLEGRKFNYHKQYLRSYRHNIPDHYVLGYHMVSYLRRKTNDPEIWGKISARAWNVPFMPFTFSNAIRKHAGIHVTGLYREMANSLQKTWQEELDRKTLTTFENVPVSRKRAYTDFLYPQPLDGEKVLIMKRGIGNIEQFCILDGKNEEHVFTPGFMNDAGMLSSSGSVVVWNEFGYDPRWSVRNYSLIKAYDFNTGRKYIIGGKKTRYASAAISADQSRIATVRTGTDYRTEVVVLSFPDGRVLQTFPNPQNDFYSMPRWSDDGKKIVCLKTSKGQRSVVVLHPESLSETEIIPPSAENIGHPVLHKDLLLYSSPATGVDNIFAIDLSSGRKFQVTESRYGAYNPAVSKDGAVIFYNDHTKDGMDVVKIPFDPARWKPSDLTGVNPDSYQFLVEQESSPNLVENITTENYPVTRYSRFRNLINPYAWGFFVENDLTEANVGISSQDLLSTTKIEGGYVYNVSEQTSSWRTGLSYQGLFPIIDVQTIYGERKVIENLEDQDVEFTWLETTVEGGLRIPLVTTSSRFRGNFSLGNSVGFTQVSNFRNSITNGGRIFGDYFFREYADDGNLVFNHFNVDAYRLLKRSTRDINSRWGQRLLIEHLSTPFGGNFDGQLLAATGILYFPGLFRHHSFWGYGAYQDILITTRTDNYIFQNEIPVPRGQSVGRYQKFYSMSANYTLPLWYPDIAIGPLLNIQRIRANGFFDYGYGENQINNFSKSFASTGVEVKFDLNIFRFLPQLDLGFRYTIGLDPATSEFQILIGTINF